MSDLPALWRPTEDGARASQMAAFARAVGRAELALDYPALHAWSVDHPAEFWGAVWDQLGIVGERGDVVVEDADRLPGARWFPGARLNAAEDLLRFARADDAATRTALIEWTERGRGRSWTYADLAHETARVRRGLLECGVQAGDRVVGYLPNRHEAVVGMLAAASLGATWSSCSPDFGISGVLDRFGQITPTVLIAADATFYGGKPRPYADKVAAVAASLAEAGNPLERVVLCGDRDALGVVSGAVHWDDFGAEGEGELTFERLPFDHPLYVMYSSGTTGLPKCMVHGAGGTLLQHAKEHSLHVDLCPDDVLFYFTTCGWMMWNWLVSGLRVGCTLVLYDGSPMAPDPLALWRMADELGVTVFGTSAKYLALLEKSGAEPGGSLPLNDLRAVLSTGSPLAPEGFDYVARAIGDVQLSSIAGGTDLISCFALGNPLLPVHRGELQGPGLGMRVEVYGPDGAALPPGQQGELVCTQAFPSMPVEFLNDPDGARYRKSYFARFPGVWCHGDWVERTEHFGVVFHGRSDTTLNPGGVRIGSAEVTRPVDDLPEVVESVAVGQDLDGDQRVVLCVVLATGAELDDALRERIVGAVRERTSPHHVPRAILAVPDLPRTLSGKVSEMAIANTINGRGVDNADALANPESLTSFVDRPELA